MTVTISVVTVVRNDIAGLQRTAASVSEQNYPHVQHVVVDGASRDDCGRWPDFADPAVELTFVSERDNGIYDAMNKGAALSHGTIVTFLNAGDRFADPDVLSFVADDYADQRWDWAYGATDRWRGDVFVSHADKRPFAVDRLLAGQSWVPHQATFFTRSILDRVGVYDLSMGIAADQELIARCGLASDPVTWSRTIADFEFGGASQQITFRQHEFEWLLMRRKLVPRGRVADVADVLRTAAHVGNVNTRRAVRRAQGAFSERRVTPTG